MTRKRLLVTWLVLGTLAVALAGFLENPYLTHVRQMPPPHPYPLDTVFLMVIFMIVQTAAMLFILKPRSFPRPVWQALFGALVSMGVLAFALGGSHHMPPAYRFYLFWLLGLFCASLIWLGRCVVNIFRSAKPAT